MMRRRFFLWGGAALGALAAVSLSSGFSSWIHEQLVKEFGKSIADKAITEGFDTDYAALLKEIRKKDYLLASVYFRLKPQFLTIAKAPDADIRRHLIGTFLRSSNLILVMEQGEPFHYLGIFFPDLYPCGNQLGSQALL